MARTPKAAPTEALPAELIPLSKLKPDRANANTHPLRNVEAIKASLEQFGQQKSIVVSKNLTIVAGNGTYLAASELGWDALSATVFPGSVKDARAFAIADNRTAELAQWDVDILAAQLADMDGPLQFAAGFTETDIAALLAGIDDGPTPPRGDPDAIPEPPKRPKSKRGDVWLLGPHRVMCGDSTDLEDIAVLVGDARPTLVHADPPYGMGKEAEGVLNDNLRAAELDAFQLSWWNAWEPVIAGNASAYIWGTAPDLWRLYYVGGLARPDLVLRNEIVWSKGSGQGQHSETWHSYPVATERCLFVMRGQQFLGNQNKDDYWEGFEPLRTWLNTECRKVGWKARDVNTLTGTDMAGHWLSKSQFAPIPERHYRTLQAAAAGAAFTVDYAELFTTVYPDLKAEANAHRRELSSRLRASRSYFDNIHDNMNDVWHFNRVVGDDRYGHATPKPVDLVTRVVKSSTAEGDTIAVPFGGSCPEIVVAEQTGRRIVAMELAPEFVDVICRRWQDFTGMKPIRESTGRETDFA